MSDSVPSCIRAPPDAEMTRSGMRSASANSAARVTFSPTTVPIEPPMKAKSIAHSAMDVPPIVRRAPDGSVAHARRGTSLLEPL